MGLLLLELETVGSPNVVARRDTDGGTGTRASPPLSDATFSLRSAFILPTALPRLLPPSARGDSVPAPPAIPFPAATSAISKL